MNSAISKAETSTPRVEGGARLVSSVARRASNETLSPAALPGFLAKRVARYYHDRVQATWGGKHILHGLTPGPDSIQVCSNDYLALSRHPKIIEAMADSLAHHGSTLLMSGIFLHGEHDPQLQFETGLARFMRAEAGVLCQSGFAANTGLIQSIANDQTPVYVDQVAHMSLWEGIRSAGARAIFFRHNDPEHLEGQIRRYGPGVVLVDTVYSTNGSVCPLEDVVDIAESQGCVMVADESHSLGTHGPNGEGLVVQLGLEKRVHFRTASLAKAFAARAGFITCSDYFREYFKFESLPAIFSSTLLPHEVAGLAATLDVIRTEGWRRERLHSNAAYIRDGLDRLGYNLNGSQSQIVSLESGSEQKTIVLREALEARGIFGSVFCAPATPKNRAMVRLSLHCDLGQRELDRILTACDEIRPITGFADWASTRRRRGRGHRHAAEVRAACG